MTPMPLDAEALLQPISEEDPGGQDIRYEPIYSEIKQARVEEEDLPTGAWSRERKTADWPLVVKLSTQALATKSKDLQIAAWLTEGMLNREGLPGLAQSLDLIRKLLEEFWDHLHPRLEEEDDLEFRAAPLDWVGQYLSPTVRLTPINARGHSLFDRQVARAVGYEGDASSSEKKKERAAAIDEGKLTAEEWDEAVAATPKSWYKGLMAGITDSLAALEALDAVGRERFGVEAPRLSPLRDALEEVRQAAQPLLDKKLEEDPDPIELVEEIPEVQEVQDEEEGLESGGGGPSSPGEPVRASGAGEESTAISAVPRSRADAEARVSTAAAFLRREDPTDPSPYLLLRGFRWGELRMRAPEVDPRLLTAPPTEQRARLRTLLLDERWGELLEGCEQLMATSHGRGWLDLQRYVLEACAGLGSEYDRVSHSIRRALHSLLQDLPRLPTLTLMDDTPTANPATRSWLEELGLIGAAAEGQDGGTSAGMRGSGRSPYDRAMEKVRAGEPEKAIELLIMQAAQEGSERERFLRRAQAAAIMVDAGREAIALPILEDLMAQIEKHGLEEYEAGEVVAQPMGLLFRCMNKMGGNDGQMQELYLRICRLDPMQAIHLQGPTAT
jgi:type VI secretion system protein ImpA